MFMPISSKDVLVKLETITQAWSKLRPAKTFAGLTLEQFLAAIKPSYDVRAEIAGLNCTCNQDRPGASRSTKPR